MRNKLLVLGTFASLAAAAPSWAAENSGSTVAAAPGSLRGTVICRGVQNVPVTADAEQSLPMQLVTRLNCGDEVAVLSDSEGYTVNIRTSDGKDGYVARLYLSEHAASSSKDRRDEAVVNNGIARWQSGAPGSDQFYSGSAVVESLTANGITVQVSLQDTGWKLRASVAINNNSSAPVHFNPAGFTLDELKPRLRAGMGMCQARICGPTLVEVLGGLTGQAPEAIRPFSQRPPVKPIPLAALLDAEAAE